ncbi:hypothetical protein GCM10008090_27830 [Arenicella chitinivorans]|uniref:DUF2947 family protein n=1 Tax=Arenicella chitinivorans TaxID=1329800 RepID=A0A918S123_9GAMM|nr:DUF2947 family protein [Arenicella chitinivorans]GHA16451.1 hypothetical protein GCM10008090_27830 [Arenicella chitinivorans]
MGKEIPGVFHDDPKMSSDDLALIEILSDVVSAKRWDKYVSEVNRHFMQMYDDEWPAKIVSGEKCWYHWVEDWNEDDFSEFTHRLESIGIPTDSALYIFWMKEVGVKTNWGVFIKNWSNFLYEDEGCILVLPMQKESLVLSNGAAWLGARGVPKT